jgi:hypothetical protein
MDDRERRELEERWIRDYGEPIDCDWLSHVASLALAEEWRFVPQGGLHPFYAKLLDLLEEQQSQREELWAERFHGTSFLELGKRVIDTGGIVNAMAKSVIRDERIAMNQLDSFRGAIRGLELSKRKHATKGADPAFGCAAHEVSQWIKAHGGGSRNHWEDVADCLRYFGHTVASAESARSAARRFRADAGRFSTESREIRPQ